MQTKFKPASPKIAALIGFVLFFPGVVFLILLVMNIEPNFGVFQSLLTTPEEGPNILGSLVALTIMVVLPLISLLINLLVLKQGLKKRNAISENPLNIILIIFIITFVIYLLASVIVDQFPCWVRIPNCD